MPKPPTASIRPASLVVAGIVLLQLMLPTPPVVAGGPVVAPPSEETSTLGIDDLGYDPAWVTPADPAPIAVPPEGGGGAAADPSVALRPTFTSATPPAVRTEVPELRTATTRTFANPDGTFSREISQGKVNYQAADGAWQPMDLSLVADADGAYALRVAANDSTARFGVADAETALAELRQGYGEPPGVDPIAEQKAPTPTTSTGGSRPRSATPATQAPLMRPPPRPTTGSAQS